MNKVLIIAGVIVLALSWQFSQASGITTSITGTGASFLNTTVVGEDRSYSNILFTEGRSAVVRGGRGPDGIDRKFIGSSERVVGSDREGVTIWSYYLPYFV